MARPVRLQESAELTGLGVAEMARLALGLPVPKRLGETPRLIVPGPHSPAIRERRAYFQTAINLAAELASPPIARTH
jgi:hypothetical protein